MRSPNIGHLKFDMNVEYFSHQEMCSVAATELKKVLNASDKLATFIAVASTMEPQDVDAAIAELKKNDPKMKEVFQKLIDEFMTKLMNGDIKVEASLEELFSNLNLSN